MYTFFQIDQITNNQIRRFYVHNVTAPEVFLKRKEEKVEKKRRRKKKKEAEERKKKQQLIYLVTLASCASTLLFNNEDNARSALASWVYCIKYHPL